MLEWSDDDNCWIAHSTGNQVLGCSRTPKADKKPHMNSMQPQISSRLLSMQSADALLCLPQAEGQLAAGTFVRALLINSLN